MDEEFKPILKKIDASVGSISKAFNACLEDVDYNELSIENKARYDLFLAYTINGLIWMYLRMNGQDPSQTIIKTELNRIKELMAELQRTIDRKTIMPRIDQGAAERFIKHGLWEPEQLDNECQHKRFET